MANGGLAESMAMTPRSQMPWKLTCIQIRSRGLNLSFLHIMRGRPR